MKDPGRLKERILETVDMAEVMLSYHTSFLFNPRNADEVQYRCPFHGKDNKPSARYYRATQSCWCWVCHKRWNAIDYVKDAEGLSYYSAINRIIEKWKVNVDDILDAPRLDLTKTKKVEESSTTFSLRILTGKIRDFRGKIPVDKYAALVTALNMIAYAGFQDRPAQTMIQKLNEKVEGIKI